MPARYYDPATYRFLSVDPASPSAGDPGSLNRYAYCKDNPIMYDDPSGACQVAGGGGGSTPLTQKEIDDYKAGGASGQDDGDDGAAAAAVSTVYGVLDFTQRKRPEFMTRAMRDALNGLRAVFGPDGPPKVIWYDVHLKSKTRMLAKLLGTSGRFLRPATWRGTHKPHEPWDDLPPIGQAALGYSMAQMLTGVGAMASVGTSLIMGAGAAAAGLTGAAALVTFAVPVLFGAVFVIGAGVMLYATYKIAETQFPNTIGMPN